jgi:hypothetical protein
VPLRATFRVPGGTLFGTTSWAVRAPAAAGLKVTLTVQVAAGARVAPLQVLAGAVVAGMKSAALAPAVETVPTTTGLPPVLVMVTF